MESRSLSDTRVGLALLWSPMSMARAAYCSSDLAATLAGVVVWSVGVPAVLLGPAAVMIAAADEPYGTVGGYFEAALGLVGLIVFVAAPPAALICFALSLVWQLGPTEARSHFRLLLLAPLPLLLPAAAGVAALAIGAVASPGFGLAAGKPWWLRQEWLGVAGWLLWAVVLFVGGPTLPGISLARLRRMLRGACIGCGYPTRGLTAPRCPECGQRQPH